MLMRFKTRYLPLHHSGQRKRRRSLRRSLENIQGNFVAIGLPSIKLFMGNDLSRWPIVTTTLTFLFFFVASSATLGQATSRTATPSKKRVNLYYHLGSIEFPADFKGFVTANWIDAWAGYVENKDGSFRIGWAAGTIQFTSETRKKDIVWREEERTPDFLIKWMKLQNKSGDTLIARIDWLEFDASIRNKADEELFKSIVRSFQQKRCVTCLSLPRKLETTK